MTVPICGDCDSKMVLRNSRFGWFWGCSRWPECDGAHGAHSDGSPMGTPAPVEVRRVRQLAHSAFDGMRRNRGFTRGNAYQRLAEMLGVPVESCHIARFDADMCRRVAKACLEAAMKQ